MTNRAKQGGLERLVVVVTGGTAGVGRATALAFARRGARVAVLSRGAERLTSTRREIEQLSGEGLAVPTDVADPRQVEAAAQEVERRWGTIDIWVNNAMATVFAPVSDIAPEDVRRATEVTYLGAVWGSMAALRRMRPRDQGVIVQVGSALAYRSIPLQAPYCAAKAALRGFTDSLRSELIREGSGVRLTMVQLSAFNTPQFDWGRTTMSRRPQPVPPVYQPELAAEAIVRSVLYERREWWVGWPAVQAILAQRLVPGFLDRVLALRGYSAQQGDDPLPERHADNLYRPGPGDPGAHGRFDAVARERSLQWWTSVHRGAFAVAAVVLLALLGLWLAA